MNKKKEIRGFEFSKPLSSYLKRNNGARKGKENGEKNGEFRILSTNTLGGE